MTEAPGRRQSGLGLTTGEAATLMGVSVSTVRRMVKSGELLAVRPAAWRYVDPDDVALWIEANDRRSTPWRRAVARARREELHRIRGNPA